MNRTTEGLRALAQATPAEAHPVLALLPPQLKEVEEQLSRLGGPAPTDDICVDLFSAGGKRLRAMLSLVVAKALGVPDRVGVAVAVAVEATHGASLLHDDVIDEADERRSRPAARKRWCNTLSVLGGDHLLLASQRVIWDLGSKPLFEAHLATLESVLAAEVLQHRAKEEWETSTSGYLEVARGKTGILFAHGCAGPAVYAGQEARAHALHAFGASLGIGFQIADDVRDVIGADPTKPAGLDFTDAVLSLPLRMAARADASIDAALRTAFRAELDPAQLPDLLERVRATGAVERSCRFGLAHLFRANQVLATVGLGEKLAPLAAVCNGLSRELEQYRSHAG